MIDKIKDAANAYRTLVGEALIAMAHNQVFERLGERLDTESFLLGHRTRPAAPGPTLTDAEFLLAEDAEEVEFAELLQGLRASYGEVIGQAFDRIAWPLADDQPQQGVWVGDAFTPVEEPDKGDVEVGQPVATDYVDPLDEPLSAYPARMRWFSRALGYDWKDEMP